MKKYKLFSIIIILFSFILTFFTFTNPSKINAEETKLTLSSKACYLIEEKSGHVIYKENEEAKMYPASMTKMMGLILVCEAITQDKIKLDDMVSISLEASKMGGSQVYLEPGEQISVNDLLKCVCIASANDAMYALSEIIGNTNSSFISLMNQKAKELKLINTNFVNVTGFDDDNHYTCAKDMGIIAKELLKYKELILPYTSIYDTYIRENTSKPFWLVNTNKLIKHYQGMDGLKTGFTQKAGYNLTSTALKNGIRLICVVMNEPTIEERSKDTTTLLNYGFSLLKEKTLFSKNEIIKEITFNNFTKETISLRVNEDINVYLYKEDNEKDINIELKFYPLTLPLKKGEIIAKLVIITPKNMKFEYPVYIDKDANKVTYLDIFIYNLSLFFK